jgi:CheY-like chemotaxis protein
MGDLGLSPEHEAQASWLLPAMPMSRLQTPAVSEPLALVCYEKLLPGSQLVNRLRDLGYRVQVVTGAGALPACAEQEKPLLVLAELESNQARIFEAIAQIKKTPATRHLPIIAFACREEAGLQSAAAAAGVTLLVSEAGLLSQLPQLLNQALQLE